MKKIVWLNCGVSGLSDRSVKDFATKVNGELSPDKPIGLVDVCIRTESAVNGIIGAVQALMGRLPNIKCGFGPSLLKDENDQLEELLSIRGDSSPMFYFEGCQSYSLLWGIGVRLKSLIERDVTYRMNEHLLVLSHSPILQMVSLAFKHDAGDLVHRVSPAGDWWLLDLERGQYKFPARV